MGHRYRPSMAALPPHPKAQDAPGGFWRWPVTLFAIDHRIEARECGLAAQAAAVRTRQTLAITLLVLGGLLGCVMVRVLQLVLNRLHL